MGQASYTEASSSRDMQTPEVSTRHDDPYLHMNAEGSDVRSANTSASLVF